MTPDRPPMMNIAMKPSAKYIGVLYWIEPPHIVPIQLKIFTPGGMAISIVDEREERVGDRAHAGREHVVAHTPNPRKPMNTPENTIAA